MMDFSGNREENNFEELISVAQDLHVHILTADLLRAFVAFFEGPPRTLRGLFLVVENLGLIFPVAEKICSQNPWRQVWKTIEEFLPTLQALLTLSKYPKTLSDYCVRLDLDGDIDSPSLRNALLRPLRKDYEFWAMLSDRSVHDDNSYTLLEKDAFALIHLQAQLVVCLAALKSLHIYDQLGNSKTKAVNAVHDVAMEKTSAELKRLHVESISPDKYLSLLGDLPENFCVRNMEVLMVDAIDALTGNFMDFIDVPFEGVETEFDEDDIWENLDGETPIDDENEEVDIPRGIEFMIPKNAKRGQEHRVAVQGGKRLAKYNILYPEAPWELSRNDFQCLTNSIKLDEDSSLDDLADKAMMQLKTWYGFDSEGLGGIWVGDRSMTSVLDRGAVLDLNASCLLIHSPLPLLKTAVPDAALEQVRSRTFWADLDLPEVCEQVLNDYVHEFKIADGEILFLLEPLEIKSRCQSVISKIKKNTNAGLTLKRIEKYLPRRMACRRTSGPALTNLALGRNDPNGLSEVHYFNILVSFLRVHHRETVRFIMGQMEEKH